MQALDKHIALVGLSGSGKSTTGRSLAETLGAPFVDTDREIEHCAGMTVQAVFARLGESEFRRLEARCVRTALAAPPAVVSLGGGSLLDDDSRRLVFSSCFVVWLHAAPCLLAARLAAQGTEYRPLLAGADPVQRLTQLLAQRREQYETAHLHIGVEGKTTAEVAAEILGRLPDRPRAAE